MTVDSPRCQQTNKGESYLWGQISWSFILTICHFKTKQKKKSQKCFKYWRVSYWALHHFLTISSSTCCTVDMNRNYDQTFSGNWSFQIKADARHYLIGGGTVFPLWSISRHNEEQEPKQKSHGGVCDVTQVTVQKQLLSGTIFTFVWIMWRK